MKSWRPALVAICAVALAVRLGHVYAVGWQYIGEVQSDAAYYHLGANLLAQGEQFIHPLYFSWYDGLRVSGADHPPGYMTVLAVPSMLGWDSVRAHLVTSCLIGTGTVALIGLLGRRVGGPRAGLLAAGFAAVYPNLWLLDGSLMSETLAVFLGVAASLAAYRAWDRPAIQRFAALGAALGLASLVRAEAAMLLVVLAAPLAIWVPGLAGWRDRLKRVTAALIAASAVMGPWVLFNMARFNEPTTLSTGLGGALAASYCDDVYYGSHVGFWSYGCQADVGPYHPAVVDGSEIDRFARSHAATYAGDHLDRFPVVVAARLGRAFGLYQPLEQLELDQYNDVRPRPAAQAGLGFFYVLSAFSVLGAVVCRRRGVPLLPLVAWLINVVVTVAVTYGQTRFRAPVEPTLVVLGAVGATYAWSRLGSLKHPGRSPLAGTTQL